MTETSEPILIVGAGPAGSMLAALLAEDGFDPAYGARPLRRTLQRLVLDPLATRMLDGQLPEGGSIRVDAVGGELAFEMLLPVPV